MPGSWAGTPISSEEDKKLYSIEALVTLNVISQHL
jgi:hypothetical protein